MESASAKPRIEVGRIIGESFSQYGANAAPLLAVAAVILGISGILQGVLRNEGGLILALLATAIGLTAQALYTGFVVKLVEDIRDGRRDNAVGDLVSSATPSIVPLIVNGFLRAIGIAIGLVLLIIPGLILLTIWSVTSPAIVSERRGALEAFGRSRQLVRGQGWQVFGVIVVAFLIYLGVTMVAVSIGVGISAAAAVVMGAVASIVTAPIAALVSAIVFFELGGGREASPATEPAVT